MPLRHSPQSVLRLTRSLRYTDLLLEQVQQRLSIISIALDRHIRKAPEPEGESAAVDDALGWFAYWFFDGRKPTLDDLAKLFDSEVLPKAREIAGKYGELAEAASQYDVAPEPFLQARSIINALADGLLKTQGQSLADHYRDGLRIMQESGIGGTSLNTAAHGAVHRLEEAATQKLEDEARSMQPKEALELMQSLGDVIDRCNNREADFRTKWGGRRPGVDLSPQERKEFTAESEDVFSHRLENHVALAQRMAVMERIAEVLPHHHLDATPIRRWIQFMGKVDEMPDTPMTDEEFKQRVKEIERSCQLDMNAVNAVVTELWRKVQPPAASATRRPSAASAAGTWTINTLANHLRSLDGDMVPVLLKGITNDIERSIVAWTYGGEAIRQAFAAGVFNVGKLVELQTLLAGETEDVRAAQTAWAWLVGQRFLADAPNSPLPNYARMADALIRASEPAQSINPIVAEPKVTDVVPDIPSAPRIAHAQYAEAESKVGKELTDREAYDYFKEHLAESPDELPDFDTWGRSLREYRRLTGTQKNRPRGARGSSARSVVSIHEIERPKPAKSG